MSSDLAKRFDALGWSLFLIWLGIYFLLPEQKNGVFSIGLGIILLAENALRKFYRLHVSRFWLVMGGLFLALGGVELFGFRLFPLLLIFCGLMVLYRYVFPKRKP